MATLAFCGLGLMGGPMAARLLSAGHVVVVWNRSPQKARALEEKGARRADTPAAAARGAEAAITMLADPPALEEVIFGPAGLAEGLSPGSALIDMSTVGPGAIRAIAARLPDGVSLLDAPVLGTVPHANEGTLKIFTGAEDEDFRRWRDVLAAMGTPVHVGPLGAGAAMKLVVNSTLGGVVGALAEALALADALGLEEPAVLDVLADAHIGAMVKSKRDLIESGSYPANFKLSLARKDLELVTRAGRESGLDLHVAAAAQALLAEAERAGLGELDYSAVVADVRGRPAGG